MWEHPATQRNVEQLRSDGVVMIGPDSGDQACGETGMGRMLEPLEIIEAIDSWLSPKPLAGRRVLVTAGPTFEPIDPVRGITNRSSGKMGFAVARACSQAGAEVTLVAGPVSLPTPWSVRRVDVQTAQQMHDAVITSLDSADARSTPFELFIAVAAVADWRPADYSATKIKKNDSSLAPALRFTPNPDILATVARRPGAPFCVGFAAESEDLERHGSEKLARKGIPLLVANIGHETFGLDDNELLLLDGRNPMRLGRASKTELARELVVEIARRMNSAGR